MTRPVQLSLIDGERPRHVGRLVTSVITGDNSDLIATVAPLYLTGHVLDVTYGRGIWWRRYVPEKFTYHDLALDGVDFRNLPYPNCSFDAVTFDPPYVPRQGNVDATNAGDQAFRARYGLEESRGSSALRELIAAGLAECTRVSRGWVLVKCCDYTNGKQFHLGHVEVINRMTDLGWRAHDLIVHATGSGPGGSQIAVVQRARRAHSYLAVFRRVGQRQEAAN